MPAKVYIITDMEGVSGISREEQTNPPESPHRRSHRGTNDTGRTPSIDFLN